MKYQPVLMLFVCLIAFAISSTVTGQEFYEIRTYKITDYDNMQKCEAYLQNAFVPALNRMGISPVGVFTNQDDVNDHSVFVFIPFSSMEAFANLNGNLSKDATYQEIARPYFERPLKKPVFNRIESRFMRAFDGMPKLAAPPESADKKPRIFELRLYESHTENHARKKVDMFNEGEIKVMQEAGLGPVFFGETLIGPQTPNLIYMLSASDMDAHKEHWQAFLKHPGWIRMKDMEKYKDTVSKIQKWYLKPTAYSQL